MSKKIRNIEEITDLENPKEILIHYYCIYDEEMKYFNEPFACNSLQEAKASIRNLVTRSEKDYVSMHLDRFSLYRTSSYDKLSGRFVSVGKGNPMKICKLSDFIKLDNNEEDE